MHFGLDGKLYAAHGDNANGSNAQTLEQPARQDHPHESRRRIRPRRSRPTTRSSATASGKNRLIWALGLRNPFTFSVQPGTGLTYVNDVGEVDVGRDQRRACRTELRMADDRGRRSTRHLSPVHQSRLQLPAQRRDADRLRDHRRCVLQPVDSDVPGVVHRQVLLRRLLLRLDLLHRSGKPGDADAVCGERSHRRSISKSGPTASLYYLARGAGSVGRDRAERHRRFRRLRSIRSIASCRSAAPRPLP